MVSIDSLSSSKSPIVKLKTLRRFVSGFTADITHQAVLTHSNQPDNVNIRCGEDFNIHVANLQDSQQEGRVER